MRLDVVRLGVVRDVGVLRLDIVRALDALRVDVDVRDGVLRETEGLDLVRLGLVRLGVVGVMRLDVVRAVDVLRVGVVVRVTVLLRKAEELELVLRLVLVRLGVLRLDSVRDVDVVRVGVTVRDVFILRAALTSRFVVVFRFVVRIELRRDGVTFVIVFRPEKDNPVLTDRVGLRIFRLNVLMRLGVLRLKDVRVNPRERSKLYP